jgi:DNA polymerase III epsilon subunit-like protein
MKKMKVLVVDTETTGLPKNFNIKAIDKPDNWPHLVSLSWAVLDSETMKIVESYSSYVRPEGWEIPAEATAIHGITTEMAMANGEPLRAVIDMFMTAPCDVIVSHNANFDKNVIINAIVYDLQLPFDSEETIIREPFLCSMLASVEICKIETRRGYKWPKLSELYYHVFKKHLDIETEHDALYDTLNLAKVIQHCPELQTALGLV